jgi:hypothetical protein
VKQDKFLAVSAALTGFSKLELLKTGVAQQYCEALLENVGPDTSNLLFTKMGELLAQPGQDEAAQEQAIREQILEDATLGTVAKNIVLLWYFGAWPGKPPISPATYRAGLAWLAIGANVSGGNPPGYGTWSLPPRIEEG